MSAWRKDFFDTLCLEGYFDRARASIPCGKPIGVAAGRVIERAGSSRPPPAHGSRRTPMIAAGAALK